MRSANLPQLNRAFVQDGMAEIGLAEVGCGQVSGRQMHPAQLEAREIDARQIGFFGHVEEKQNKLLSVDFCHFAKISHLQVSATIS